MVRPSVFISTNNTCFPAEGFTSIDKHCLKSFVVVVRATYDVDADGRCTLSEVQSPFVHTDTHYSDPETTSVRAESGIVPIKATARGAA